MLCWVETKSKGGGIHFANIQKSLKYPLIDALSAKDPGEFSDRKASNCFPNSLDKRKVEGNILLCEGNYDDEYSAKNRLDYVKSLGGIGVILIYSDQKPLPVVTGSSPMSIITYQDGHEIQSYINLTRNPVATILPTVTVESHTPAPSVAYFSAIGPVYKHDNLIKLDIAAPRVDILSIWPSNDTDGGKRTSSFNLLSGTSMACPHASGIAATVKSKYPSWSPAIKSAKITTAIQTNNVNAPITLNNGDPPTAYAFGAGEVNTTGPLQPGSFTNLKSPIICNTFATVATTYHR
ncbi:hypothetical protein ACH5RR_027513 [Cinchona calisaya]|uniref:Peptidase S8/S53 domain-containing protein n=1 Tax=Cinchona calisaya TaxID=153742 RepID=A0ABD2Z7I3_9GENT